VTKLSVRHVDNPHTNQQLNEAEVWLKDAKHGRRRLDLLVKRRNGGNNRARRSSAAWLLDGTCDEMARELAAYTTGLPLWDGRSGFHSRSLQWWRTLGGG